LDEFLLLSRGVKRQRFLQDICLRDHAVAQVG